MTASRFLYEAQGLVVENILPMAEYRGRPMIHPYQIFLSPRH